MVDAYRKCFDNIPKPDESDEHPLTLANHLLCPPLSLLVLKSSPSQEVFLFGWHKLLLSFCFILFYFIYLFIYLFICLFVCFVPPMESRQTWLFFLKFHDQGIPLFSLNVI